MEGERKSSINKIVGADIKTADFDREEYEQLFSGDIRFSEAEREKTHEEVEIINALIPLLQTYLAEYGAKPLPVTAKHIHIFDKRKMSEDMINFFEKKMTSERGVYAQHLQRVVILAGETRSLLDFANVLTHELAHFYSFNVARRYENVAEPRVRNTGLDVIRRITGQSDDRENEKVQRYFNALNEAVTEELAKRFFSELKKIPMLKDEIAEVERARQRLEDNNISTIHIAEVDTAEGKRYDATIFPYAYPQFREMLYTLIDEIDAHYPGRFASKDVIFSVFARAAMTGEVKDMAVLVEGLGRGRLRELAKQKA